jgi:UDP-N-acetylmuramoyl-L-alanyl-D-glutamate--2,6-diaminopimelate ligase
VPSPRPTSVAEVALGEVAGLVGAPLPSGSEAVRLKGVSLDSRAVQAGDLYAALPGFVAHGGSFAAQAVHAGAVAVLTDPQGADLAGDLAVPVLVVADPRAALGDVSAVVYGQAARDLTLVGITGTNGKTTTAYLVEAALRALGERTGLLGTVESRVGETRIKSVRTTPEATDLHALFAVMREAGAVDVVMEVSSHALAQHRVDGAVFDVALFTNLSQDHLDFHETMEDYFGAKASLFTPAHSRRGVVCVDDEWGARLALEAEVPVVTLGSNLGSQADWVVPHKDWPLFTLSGPAGVLELQCHLPGDFNVVNTALAAVCLLELGHSLDEVARALQQEPVVPGRMEVVTGSDPDPEVDPRCVVDYAHTPDAVEAALRALRPSTPGRLVVVLGAGGDRDRGKRRAMGAAARTWADDVVVTDDNPRSEDPAGIRSEVLAGATVGPSPSGRPAHEVRTTPGPARSRAGRGEAIAEAVQLARRTGRGADNTVLVLGKGHETGQEIAGVVHAFDDREALRAALDGLVYRPEATS